MHWLPQDWTIVMHCTQTTFEDALESVSSARHSCQIADGSVLVSAYNIYPMAAALTLLVSGGNIRWWYLPLKP